MVMSKVVRGRCSWRGFRRLWRPRSHRSRREMCRSCHIYSSTLQYLVSEAAVYLHTHLKMIQTASHKILTPREEIIQAQEPAVRAKRWWDEHVKTHGPVPPKVTINLYFLFSKESQTVKVSDQTMFLRSWVIQALHTTEKYKEGNHSRRLQIIPKREETWKCPLYVIKTTGVLEVLT